MDEPKGPSATLIDLLKRDVEYHDAMLFTTPHLSQIRNKELELLALLEKKNHE